jgi:hypothetical protein
LDFVLFLFKFVLVCGRDFPRQARLGVDLLGGGVDFFGVPSDWEGLFSDWKNV